MMKFFRSFALEKEEEDFIESAEQGLGFSIRDKQSGPPRCRVDPASRGVDFHPLIQANGLAAGTPQVMTYNVKCL